MSETPASTPAAGGSPRRIPWQRVRIVMWSFLLLGATVVCGIVWSIRAHPHWALRQVLARIPFPTTVERATWTDPRTLKLVNIKIGDFFYARAITVSFSFKQLWSRHLQQVEFFEPQLFTKPMMDALAKSGPGSGEYGGIDLVINTMVIRHASIQLSSGLKDLPAIDVRVGTRQPVIIHNLDLSKPDAADTADDEQVAEIQNVNIVSPFDALARVLSFPLTRIRFTYGELWRHKIREIDLVMPKMYLGQDLFWFTDQFKKAGAEAPAVAASSVDSPWSVDHLKVQYGRLAITAFGQRAAELPFFFETEADNVRLDQLDKLTTRSAIVIHKLNREYPEYKVNIVGLEGSLQFSLPPTDAKANNVVNTIQVEELAWNNIPATDVWSSVTFDPQGIYARLGGQCEGGYIQGNFEVYYANGFTWNADLSVTKVNCQPVAERLVGKYFKLSGTLDGQIGVKGRSTEILDCQGKLSMAHPGQMEITSVDEMLKKIPADMSAVKQDLLRIVASAVRIYPYDTGTLDLSYQPTGGGARLNLESSQGNRHFEVAWHPHESSTVANDPDRR